MPIKIVTDSTSDLPKRLVQELDIKVVPLNVHFGTDVFMDGVDLSADDFYDRLINGPELPKTSQPSVGDFITAFEDIGQNADGILSIHVSSKLSGTFNSANQAKDQAKVNCPIEVIDTYQVSMGVGMVAIVAARAAQQGGDLEHVVSVANHAVGRSECMALVETLEYLHKGGRIGKAGALLGSILKIRPMIIMREGEVHQLAKERSRQRGILRLQNIVAEYAPLQELSVMYSTTPEDAAAVGSSLRKLLPSGTDPIIVRLGPVIGTYAGPGALGIGLLGAEAG